MVIANRNIDLQEGLAILRRRIWWIAIPAVLCPIVAVLVTYVVPPKYLSEAMVLVEPQRVPDRFVTPIVTEQMNSRLATIREQVMSRSRLQPIIERFGLYHEDFGKVSIEELVERTRKQIEIGQIRTDAGSSGFRIAFTWDDRRLAQQVCKEIMSIFMEENLKIREQHAQDTTDFLSNQLEDAKRKLDEQDAKFAEFKRQHLGQLPSDEGRNMQMLSTLNNRLEVLNQSLAQARQQKMVQESLLAQATAPLPATSSGEFVVSNPTNAQSQLESLQAQLVALRSRYTEDHPDVKKLEHQIEILRGVPVPTKSVATRPQPARTESPQAAQIRMALRLLDDDIRMKVEEQAHVQRGIREYEAKIQIAPAIEEQSKALGRDYQIALQFYNELLSKKTQSEMATDLERRQQGEQFRVMDPPNLPEKPIFPKKRTFGAAGLMVGFALGIGLALFWEIREDFIRDEGDVASCLQLPVVALVYELKPEESRTNMFGRRHKEAEQKALNG